MAGRRQHSNRHHLAYLAARLIAEDGLPDFASARRKVARQQGIRNERDLPDDRAIAAALRSFQALYQPDVQPQRLRDLRALAVRAMTLLQEFDPWLVGPVLTGMAGAHAQVQLHVYSDRVKDLQLFVLGVDLPCQFGEWRGEVGGRVLQVPMLELMFGPPEGQDDDEDQSPVQVILFASSDPRQGERARLPQVRRLLSEQDGRQEDVGLAEDGQEREVEHAVLHATALPSAAVVALTQDVLASDDGPPGDGFALKIEPRRRSWD